MRPKFKTQEVRVHVIEYEAKDGRIVATCNCNWTSRHRRGNVIEAKADRHLEAVGGGIKPL